MTQETQDTILLVEDTPSLQMIYKAALLRAGHQVETASSAREALAGFRRLKPSVMLLDLMLPDGSGLEVMRDVLIEAPQTRIIVITANGSINRAVEMMRAGAHEFLVKPFDDQRLTDAVANARRAAQLSPITPAATEEVPGKLGHFIGSSQQMQAVYSKIRSVARSMATVFITGESGTGKEVCAEAVHASSPRASGPFIALNCGAIPADLLESEVFGHLKGSFTGAISDKPGAAAAASGGTLFLDEICEMDLNLQTKLLRFLQTSSITPVGATKPRKVDVRIICATNRNPLEEVRAGRFREDLYYRLHVVPIHMPTLRERGDDVNEIAERLLGQMAKEEGHSFRSLSPEVRTLFRNLRWPGNVRQLINVLRNVVVLNEGEVVTTEMLPNELYLAELNAIDPEPRAGTNGSAAGLGFEAFTPQPEAETGQVKRLPPGLESLTLAEVERLVIEAALERHHGSIPKAARELDVSPSTIYRKREAWQKEDQA